MARWATDAEAEDRVTVEERYRADDGERVRTAIHAPRSTWLGDRGRSAEGCAIVAHYLRNFDPLTAEHLLWAYGHRTSTFQSEGDEPFWQKATLDQERGNGGTNPHLRSVKYTGHGIILRAGVDTPEELSVHLDQVDQGPNYRWGR